jgi:hypothetical protein
MIAIDTLVHNFLQRTGILSRAHAEHVYGPHCYWQDRVRDDRLCHRENDYLQQRTSPELSAPTAFAGGS